MKRKGLYLLAALAAAGVGAAHAQSMDGSSDEMFDGRWYVAPTIGAMYNDGDRMVEAHQYYWSLGIGKFVNPHWSIEGFVDHTERSRDLAYPGTWTSTGVGIAARYFPGDFESFHPFVMMGVLGELYHVIGAHDWTPAIQAGVGFQTELTDNTDLRLGLTYRVDHDDNTLPSNNGYGDFMAGIGLVHRFGEPPAPPAPVAPPPPPPPPAPDCSQLDDDNDAVNNCVDQCPATEAGTIVGPDGCAKSVIIDLRGVNFKFDRPKPGESDIAPTLQEPTADSLAILDQAIDTLQRYPAVNVALHGYTDSIGSEAYNQKLSERRAQIVYGYLTSHGIGADRITGVEGFGESHPVATNDTDEGRARNRRTELKVENPEQPMRN